MNLLFTILPLALKVGGAWFDWKVTGKITETEYRNIANAFAIARGRGNKSADARLSVDNQFSELEKEKANAKNKNNPQAN